MKKRNKGRVKNVQTTKIDGVEFRSRLEAFTYAELKKAKLKRSKMIKEFLTYFGAVFIAFAVCMGGLFVFLSSR